MPKSWIGRPWIETVENLGTSNVKRMLDDARTTGVSAFRQVTQRFPSGLELPMEYTTVLLGGRAGLLAIGKNLQAVAELQARLIAAQQAMERDYWKLREVETRYRLLFDASLRAGSGAQGRQPADRRGQSGGAAWRWTWRRRPRSSGRP